jgi:hypothetical protein
MNIFRYSESSILVYCGIFHVPVVVKPPSPLRSTTVIATLLVPAVRVTFQTSGAVPILLAPEAKLPAVITEPAVDGATPPCIKSL